MPAATALSGKLSQHLNGLGHQMNNIFEGLKVQICTFCTFAVGSKFFRLPF
jgi:hypothetical protein